MDDIMASVVKGYTDGFNAYQITSPSLQNQVNDYIARINAFANSVPDVTAFFSKIADTGLQEEYSSLITKVAMASMGAASENGAPKTDYSSNAPTPVISVKEFVEQYRTAYNEIKKSGYRKRAEAAYEALLNVPNRTSDMLDAQIIIEQERLTWKIVSEDSLDIFYATLEAMDPLNKITTAGLLMQIDAYEKSLSDEQLTYMLEMNELPKAAIINKNSALMNAILMLADHLVKYSTCKIRVWEWQNETIVKSNLNGIISLRAAAKQTLAFIKESYNMTFDDILANEGLALWLLVPQNADALGRIKTSLNPHNYDAFRDIIYNEILADISVADILKRRDAVPVWYDFKGSKADAYASSTEKKAAQLNASLDYYKYLNKQSAVEKTSQKLSGFSQAASKPAEKKKSGFGLGKLFRK